MKNKSALKLAYFLQNLWWKEDRDDSEIPSLSDEETNNTEGKITLKEVTRALKNMKNNKSLSTDDFTSDFFKALWKQVGYFGVRSLSDSFEQSELSATQKNRLMVCIPNGDKPKEYIKNWGLSHC